MIKNLFRDQTLLDVICSNQTLSIVIVFGVLYIGGRLISSAIDSSYGYGASSCIFGKTSEQIIIDKLNKDLSLVKALLHETVERSTASIVELNNELNRIKEAAVQLNELHSGNALAISSEVDCLSSKLNAHVSEVNKKLSEISNTPPSPGGAPIDVETNLNENIRNNLSHGFRGMSEIFNNRSTNSLNDALNRSSDLRDLLNKPVGAGGSNFSGVWADAMKQIQDGTNQVITYIDPTYNPASVVGIAVGIARVTYTLYQFIKSYPEIGNYWYNLIYPNNAVTVYRTIRRYCWFS